MSPSRATGLELTALALLMCGWVALGAHPQSKTWLDSGLLSPLFALLIVALALGSGLMARLLSIHPFQLLGNASYAIYILQEPVLIWTMKLPLIGALPKQMFVPFYVLTLIAASLACQQLIAEPARIWLLGARKRSGVGGLGPTSSAGRRGSQGT